MLNDTDPASLFGSTRDSVEENSVMSVLPGDCFIITAIIAQHAFPDRSATINCCALIV